MKIIKPEIFLPLIILLTTVFQPASGQQGRIIKKDTKEVQQKDIKDVFDDVFNRKYPIDTLRLKSKGPFLTFIPSAGYSLHTGIRGTLVGSASFYTADERRKISRIDMDMNYSQYHQYWIDAISNVFLEKQRLHLFGDTRYYKFPTQTYGIGPNSLSNDPLQIDYSFFRLYQILFLEIFHDTYIGLGYNLDYHWNIKSDSIDSDEYSQFIRYQKKDHSISSGLSLNLLYDSRNNMINPQNGTFANLQYRPNLILLGSSTNWQSLLIEVRHYIRLPSSSNNILALWSYNDITLSGTPPYLDMPSTGWDDYSETGRGYVPGRFTGRNMIYLETEYRFALTRNGLLGGVIFGNGQMLPERIPSDIHTIIPGGGIGLRIKFSKISGTNLAIDYGFGIRGSHGFFFNMGEVF